MLLDLRLAVGFLTRIPVKTPDTLAEGETASIVLCGALPAVDAVQCGLLLDEWTELVPSARETTGIAFHFDRPNAVAPQAMLLAWLESVLRPAIESTSIVRFPAFGHALSLFVVP